MKKALKSLICAVMAAIMVFSCTTVAFAKNDVTPVIMVHGMGATALYKNPGTSSEEEVGNFDISSILGSSSGLLFKLLAAAEGQNVDAEIIINELATFANGFSDLACNTNGNSKEKVGVNNYWTDSLANHQDYLSSRSSAEPALCRQICDQVGAKNVYIFNYDWRIDACTNAKKLNSLVNTVKNKTGKSKVTLVSGSEGTAVVSAYIDAYKGKNDIKRTVFIDGAFDGVAVLNLFKQDLVFSKPVLMKYINSLMNTLNVKGFDISTLTPITNSLGGAVGHLCTLLNQIKNNKTLSTKLYKEVLYPVFGCIPALWEFIPYNDFNACVNKMSSIGFLNKNSGLYKKLVAYHGVQGRLKSNLKSLKNKGVEIAIVANYGTPAIPVTSAYQNQTDILIDTKYASVGATTANYGTKLSTSGKYVSSDKVIDASTCLLPDNTWFVKGIQHLDYWYDTEATQFVAKLATTNTNLNISSIKKSTGVGQFVGTDSNQNIISVNAKSASSSVQNAKIATSPETGIENVNSILAISAFSLSAVLLALFVRINKRRKASK